MKNNNKLITFLVALIILSLTGLGLLLMQNSFLRSDNESKTFQVKVFQSQRDSIKREYVSKFDSLAMLQDNISYTSGGRKVTISDIIKSANSWYLEKETLKQELENCLTIQKAYVGGFNKVKDLYSEEVNKVNENAHAANENARVASTFKDIVKKYNPEKYREYEFFYQSTKKHFGLDYEVVKETDSTRTLIFKPNSKLDSAIGYFEAYKAGKIRTNITIKTEEKKKKKN